MYNRYFGKLQEQLLCAGIIELNRSLGIFATPFKIGDGTYPKSHMRYASAYFQVTIV